MGSLVRLVDDLLDVSRISRGKVELRREPMDLAGVVERAVTATRPQVEGRGHALSLAIEGGPFQLDADATRLEQVLVNLLNNAAKYTDPGGEISVRLERRDSEAVLRVRDTGRGIPRDMLERVFEVFVQVSPTIDRGTGGLGLGLTLVKRLVELHGGHVEALSDGEGKGSEFVVRLPLAAPAGAVVQPEPGAAGPRVPEGRKRILLVEDTEDARNTLKELLESLGHQVTMAAEGNDGAAKALELLPDVALIDVGLPGIDGYEVARRVRAAEAGKELFLVALTGYGGSEERAKAEAAGFDLHVTKADRRRRAAGRVERTPVRLSRCRDRCRFAAAAGRRRGRTRPSAGP